MAPALFVVSNVATFVSLQTWLLKQVEVEELHHLEEGVEHSSQEVVVDCRQVEEEVLAVENIAATCPTTPEVQEEHTHPDRNQNIHRSRRSCHQVEEEPAAMEPHCCQVVHHSLRNSPEVGFAVPTGLRHLHRCDHHSFLVGSREPKVPHHQRHQQLEAAPKVVIRRHKNRHLDRTHRVQPRGGQQVRSKGCQRVPA